MPDSWKHRQMSGQIHGAAWIYLDAVTERFILGLFLNKMFLFFSPE